MVSGSPVVRRATADDEPFLWAMLYYAAHMGELGVEMSAVRATPALAKYVTGWGRRGDLGAIALDDVRGERLGAAWLREFPAAEPGRGFVDPSVPELAVAVLPGQTGRGVGTVVLTTLLAAAAEKYERVALKVRRSSAAVRLYERLGFQAVPGREFVNRVGGVSLVMERILRG
jgi:GNAT superfamily N-acetyltransferase